MRTITITINVDSQESATVYVNDNKKTKSKKTALNYINRLGKPMPVYVSSKGKKFVKRTKNGKVYRQYIKDKHISNA